VSLTRATSSQLPFKSPPRYVRQKSFWFSKFFFQRMGRLPQGFFLRGNDSAPHRTTSSCVSPLPELPHTCRGHLFCFSMRYVCQHRLTARPLLCFFRLGRRRTSGKALCFRVYPDSALFLDSFSPKRLVRALDSLSRGAFFAGPPQSRAHMGLCMSVSDALCWSSGFCLITEINDRQRYDRR